MIGFEPHAIQDNGEGRDTMRSRRRAVGLAAVIAGSLLLVPVTGRAEEEPRVRIEYDPPHLSVAAREVSLDELLRLIGTSVGFTVSEGRAASGPVTVSIDSAFVDDVLRQLLRAENHTILYRKDAHATVMIDRIVLLGASAGGATVAGASPGQEVAHSASGSGGAAVAGGGEVPLASRAGESAPTDDEQPTVGDMLKSHALAGVPPQPAAPAEPAALPDSTTPSVPPSLEESLAITTQRAQQGVTALVEGLQQATRSLVQPAPAAATGQ
jgi:hypothetical protein